MSWADALRAEHAAAAQTYAAAETDDRVRAVLDVIAPVNEQLGVRSPMFAWAKETEPTAEEVVALARRLVVEVATRAAITIPGGAVREGDRITVVSVPGQGLGLRVEPRVSTADAAVLITVPADEETAAVVEAALHDPRRYLRLERPDLSPEQWVARAVVVALRDHSQGLGLTPWSGE